MHPADNCAARRCIWTMRKDGVFLKAYGITDRGLVRKQNQDAYRILQKDDALCGVVCDGMGGARAGNVASEMAVTLFTGAMNLMQDEEPGKIMMDALELANREVLRRSRDDMDCAGMGTTLVAAYLAEPDHAYVLNVGDSRAYQISPENGIRQITRDHSLVADLVSRGKITKEQARTHPNKNIITRALGTEEHTVGDLFEVDLEEDEYILLCSDGLSNQVSEQELLYEVIHGGEINTCCQRLLDIALRRGAPDNVTVILISVGDNVFNREMEV